ncbi:hypothetical protein [Calderihabitans maritimus]|uniref:Uncharacterized protein n=1 Tax=Calderihabitans maritimus TaxID=1246530 RepID=A0A1Z5HVB9_9FIRM|nr:hypothetical protein [Calderihabitans maritimus]GAW93483.1 hypothetical protein Moth_0696 [Calderihabitans maritimus]
MRWFPSEPPGFSRGEAQESGGNYTEVWFERGERLVDPRRVKTVVRALAGVFSQDPRLLRKRYAKTAGTDKAIPLPLREDFVLVPIKTRTAWHKDHGTCGYVVLSKVVSYEAVEEGEFRSRIYFSNGMVLKSLWRIDTVRNKFHQAEDVQKEYRRLYLVKSTPRELREYLPAGKLVYIIDERQASG